jgi:AraC family transcriptional regulator
MPRELAHLECRDFVVREVVYEPGLRMPRHAHDYSNVTVVLGGGIDEVAERGRHRGTPGSVVWKPAGCEHENGVSGFGARTLSIQLRGTIDGDAGSRPWTWFEDPEVVRAALAFTRADARTLEARAMELLASVLTMSHGGGIAPAWLARILETLQSRFDEPLRLGALARDCGRHPVYVARTFRRFTGVAMHDYLRALRLRHARHLLSATKRSIAAIAGEAGFTDASHLSRTFREHLGLTPRAFRNVAAEVQPVQVRAGNAP